MEDRLLNTILIFAKPAEVILFSLYLICLNIFYFYYKN